MTTAYAPASFTTDAGARSIDLLRPSTQAPSGEETLDVTIAAWTQAQLSQVTPTPHGATEAEHFLALPKGCPPKGRQSHLPHRR